MKTFGERLRYARELRALTQRRLAQLSKVSQSAIGNYESGLRFSSRSLLNLARALEVNPLWLETGQPPMQASGGALLLSEPPAEPAQSGPHDWLLDDEGYALFQSLSAHDQQTVRRTVLAVIQTMARPADALAEPPVRRRPRKRTS